MMCEVRHKWGVIIVSNMHERGYILSLGGEVKVSRTRQ
jgi:hypothetical protein